MASDDFERNLKILRSENPSWFEDRDDRVSFDDHYLLDIKKFNKHEYFDDWYKNVTGSEELQPEGARKEDFEAFGGGHAGGLTPGDESIDTLAFYLPFHLFPEKWGLYIFLDGILKINDKFRSFLLGEGLSISHQFELSRKLLEAHEMFHHMTEMYVTRLETIFRDSVYATHAMPRYQKTFGTSQCYEETCANTFAREKVKQLFSTERFKYAGGNLSGLNEQINKFFRNQSYGYREAANFNDTNWKKTVRNKLFEDYLYNYPSVKPNRSEEVTYAMWGATANWAPAASVAKERIFLIARKNSKIGQSIPETMIDAIEHLMAFKSCISPIELSNKFKKSLSKTKGLDKHWKRAESKLSNASYKQRDWRPYPNAPEGKNVYSMNVSGTPHGGHRAHFRKELNKTWMGLNIGTHLEMGHGK